MLFGRERAGGNVHEPEIRDNRRMSNERSAKPYNIVTKQAYPAIRHRQRKSSWENQTPDYKQPRIKIIAGEIRAFKYVSSGRPWRVRHAGKRISFSAATT